MIPGSGRSAGEGKVYPLQYSGLGNSIDCIVHGITKSQTQLSDFHFQKWSTSKRKRKKRRIGGLALNYCSRRILPKRKLGRPKTAPRIRSGQKGDQRNLSGDWPCLYHSFLNLYLFFSFWPCYATCRILVPQPGIKTTPPAVETQSPNHCTTMEVPSLSSLSLSLVIISLQCCYEDNTRQGSRRRQGR